MSLKLYTYPALFKTQKILIAAEYAGAKIDVVTDVKPEQIQGMSVHGKCPCLETPEGTLSEANAILRYVARLAPTSALYGATPFATAQIDSWVEFSANELDVPSTLWIAPILGWMENDAEVTERATADLKKAMQVLESHLKTETYLVGRSMTIADVAVAVALLLPMKLTLDEKARNPFPNVCRWFDLCVNQPAYVDVIGKTTLCVKPLEASPAAAAGGKPANNKAEAAKSKAEAKPKTEAKPKEESAKAAAPAGEKRKQDAKKAEEEGDATEEALKLEEKKKNPLEDLPKSPLVLDEWKRTYSNAPGGDCRQAMPWFWEHYDKEGYSLWFQSYNYNDELKTSFMTSNLVGGFIQRTDELRKYAFGVMQIVGTPQAQKIVGAWLIRGTDIAPMLNANEDAECYTWKKLSTDPTPEEKQRLTDIWCEENELEVDGEKLKVLDGKVFK